MSTRTPRLPAALVAAAFLTACSGETGSTAAPSTVEQPGTSAAVTEPSADAEELTDAEPVDAEPTDLTATEEAATGEDASLDDPADDGGGSAGVDPELAALADLSGDEVCALLTPTDISGVLGMEVDDGMGTAMAGLGVNCTWYQATEFVAAAKVEFGAIDYGTLVMVYEMAPVADGEPPFEDCTVAGLPAKCQEGYKAAITFNAKTLVQLGSTADLALLVEANTTTADAIELAEIVIGKLGA